MKSYLRIVTAFACVIGTCANAGEPLPRDVGEINMETFNDYDQDADGLLSRDEYHLYAMSETSLNPSQAEGRFLAMDGDSSNSLTFDEFNGGVCCA